MIAVDSSVRTHWGIHLLTLPVSTHVMEGVAKICGFEVLRHGTSFPYYFGILQTGADPSHGGKTTSPVAFDADTKRQAKACKNRFFVFKDSEAYLNDKSANLKIPVIAHIFKRTHTRLHAVLAGVSLARHTQNKVLRVTQKIFYGISSFFCPTIRFVYRKDEMQIFNSEEEFEKQRTSCRRPRFISDEDYGNIAYKTPDVLPNDRIGLVGLCKHARWSDVKRTFQNHPGQVLLGSVQLIMGIALTVLGAGIIL